MLLTRLSSGKASSKAVVAAREASMYVSRMEHSHALHSPPIHFEEEGSGCRGITEGGEEKKKWRKEVRQR